MSYERDDITPIVSVKFTLRIQRCGDLYAPLTSVRRRFP